MCIDALLLGMLKADKKWEGIAMIFIGLIVGIPILTFNVPIGLFFLVFSWISAMVIFQRSRERKMQPHIPLRRDKEKSIVSQLAHSSHAEKND
jgi:hypothetical protein